MWKQNLVMKEYELILCLFSFAGVVTSCGRPSQRCSNAKMIAHSIIRSWKKVRHLTDAAALMSDSSSLSAAAIWWRNLEDTILILTLSIFDMHAATYTQLQRKSEKPIAAAQSKAKHCIAADHRNNSCSNEMVTRWQVSSAKSQDWQPFPSHRRVRVMAHRGTGCSREMSQRKWMLFDVFQLNNARDPFYIYFLRCRRSSSSCPMVLDSK